MTSGLMILRATLVMPEAAGATACAVVIATLAPFVNGPHALAAAPHTPPSTRLACSARSLRTRSPVLMWRGQTSPHMPSTAQVWMA